MAFNVLTYGARTLDSTQVKRVNFSHGINVGEQSTLSGYDLTQTGSIKPLTVQVQARLRGDITQTMIDWINELEARNLNALTLINISWGNYYLVNLDFDIEGLDNNAASVFADMTINFTRSVNF